MGGITSFLGFGGGSDATPRPSTVRVGGKVVPLKVPKVPRVDYEAEGQRLMEEMTSGFERGLYSAMDAVFGSVPSKGNSGGDGSYHDVDVLWTHPESNGMLYVGNDRAAKNEAFLRDLKVTAIVNCTRPSKHGQLNNYHKHTGRFRYYDLPMAHWDEYCLETPNGVDLGTDKEKFEACLRFLLPAMVFCLRSLKRGECVLVHCLAGAHRAGTMGILALMHFQGMAGSDAIKLAQKLRPIIEPISDFPKLISLFEGSIRWRFKGALQPSWNLPLSEHNDAATGVFVRSKSFVSVSGGGNADRSSFPSTGVGGGAGGGGDNRIAESLQRRGSYRGEDHTPSATPRATPRGGESGGEAKRRGSFGVNAFAAVNSMGGRDGPSQTKNADSITIGAVLDSKVKKTFDRRKSYAFGEAALYDEPLSEIDLDSAAAKLGVVVQKVRRGSKSNAGGGGVTESKGGKRHSYN